MKTKLAKHISRSILFAAAALPVVFQPAATAATGVVHGNVVVGSAAFSHAPGTTTITAANKTIVEYARFNIGANETVRFIQPSPTATVLNRVTGSDPSNLLGTLQANGIVYLVNPAGIYFGKNAVVDTGQIYAAAGNLANTDFLAGRNHFTNLTGTVVNEGQIRAATGAVLAGKHVVNDGIIAAGKMVVLSAGDEILVGEREGHLFVEVGSAAETTTAPNAPAEGVRNNGDISAPDGRVLLAAGDLYSIAIRNAGVIRARETRLEGVAPTPTTQQVPAQEVASAEVWNDGTILATSPDSSGGTITLTGAKVGLGENSLLDASGSTGGGTIHVGGGYQGNDPALRNARAVFVAPTATLRADAQTAGDGGKIIIWSDNSTRYHGHLSARAAANGTGGFAEVSSKNYLDFSGTADLSAPNGKTGALLLDPGDLEIVPGSTNTDITGTGPIFEPNGDSATLGVEHLNTALVTADVTVKTSGTGNITVSAAISSTTDKSLTLTAGGNIIFADGAAVDLGSGGLTLNAGGGISITASSVLLKIGALTIIQNNALTLSDNTTNLFSKIDFRCVPTAFDLTATGGITLSTTRPISSTGNITFNSPVTLGKNTSLSANTVIFNSTVTGGGKSLTIRAGVVGSWLGDPPTTTVAGNAEICGDITGVSTLTIDGNTSLSADVTTTGAQSYSAGTGGIIVSQDTTLSGSEISLTGNISLTADFTVTATNKLTLDSLTGNSSSNLTFTVPTLKSEHLSLGTLSGINTLSVTTTATGNGNELRSSDLPASGFTNLALTAAAGITLSSGINTTGTQSYNSAITLTNNVTLEGFSVSLPNNITLAANTLTVPSNTTFATSTTVSYTAPTLSGDASTTATLISGPSDYSNITAVSLTGADSYRHGRTTTSNALEYGFISGKANLTWNNAASTNKWSTDTADANWTDGTINTTYIVGDSVTFATNGASITLTANLAPSSITINQATTFTGTSIALSTATLTINAAASFPADLTVIGTTTLSTDITTGGNQSYSTTTLNGSDGIHLTANSGNGTVTFTDALTGNAKDLKITGAGTFKNTVSSIAKLEVTGATTLKDNIATITTSSTQTYGSLVLEKGVSLSGSAITTGNVTGGGKDLSVTATAGAISLGQLGADAPNKLGNVTLNASGGSTFNGAVFAENIVVGTGATNGGAEFKSTVNAAQLTVTGDAVFKGAVSAETISVTGTTDFNTAGAITTTGTQTYTGTVSLSQDTTLNATGNITANNVTGGGKALSATATAGAISLGQLGADAPNKLGDVTLSATGGSVFNEAVFTAKLTVTGAAQIGANITTTGEQFYTGGVKLAENITFSGSSVGFGSTVGSTDTGVPRDITIVGDAIFEGAVSAKTISVTGTTDFATAGTITTTGTQTYTGAVNLLHDTTLNAAGNITANNVTGG
ncbi:MAG: filamentous hemagglutinin N-terminal domain-containing protein, partial [Puniceicoccales bacterium]|nr:filamentous hemagglutinin N-terminal domain-containing protein [Puniceicoccales bacterium]